MMRESGTAPDTAEWIELNISIEECKVLLKNIIKQMYDNEKSEHLAQDTDTLAEQMVRNLTEAHTDANGFVPPYIVVQMLKSIAKKVAVKNDNSDLLSSIEGFAKHEETGRANCTYGDTEYDSLTVCYGYNLALKHLREILSKVK